MDMESSDWFQFVSEQEDGPSSMDGIEKPVSGKAELPPVPPPVPPMPTPPASSHGSPCEEESEPPTIVSVSTTFYPGANLMPLPPDLIIVSSDTVFFYVHAHQLLGVSENGFSALIPASPEPVKDKDDIGPIVPVADSSQVLNIVLHTFYDMSCAHYSPAIPTLLTAVDALAKYGVPLQKYAAPNTPLYQLLLSQAPAAPMDFYSLAAQYDLYDLAVPISSHLLAYPLFNLSDEHAAKMGPLYMKKLVFLHLGRVDALKRLLLPPPQQHPATTECDFIEQKKLTRAWALASAYLAWDARADLSTSAMESALCSLNDHLSCDLCKASLRERVKQLIIQWAVVKVRIEHHR
ncbi:hypothetical protein PHLCEN_2v9350 [Hermanssonia centrifuga]|uniref:BTB domain-containing protein n=1 Tax=Hermanssonia centrifuga TaxID=98765 RepID=A0A2R6NR26_9APHY|nr:hypothetical protein PHLCEN_2v9350 [Hermanssonia centrifuga]